MLGGLIIIINFILASVHFFLGDVMLHTDIARDLLLIQNQVLNSKIELIGPRAGGIPGMFFGPLWYWITIPSFIIGNGNPIVVGIFWYILVVLLLGITYFIARKVFDNNVAFISLVLMSFYAPNQSLGFTSSFGSLLVSPLIFYFTYKFIKTKRTLPLIITIFLVGIIYHFQVAFAMIMLFLTFLLTIFYFAKTRRKSYFLSYLVLLIPFSTFILFELRHNFLEIHSLFNFIFSKHVVQKKITLLDILINRFQGFIGGFDVLQNFTSWSMILFLLINIFIAYKLIKGGIKKSKEFYALFYIYYVLFWGVTFLFKGLVWGYYSWAFLPLTVIIFSSLIKIIDKKIFIIALVILCTYSLNNNWISVNDWVNNFHNKDSSSWTLNHSVAKKVFNKEKGSFGYFVFSPDEFGFPIKYAMSYVQKNIQNKKAHLCQKMKTTYLIYYPDDSNSIADSKYWKYKKINLHKNPISVEQMGALKIERYTLTPEEIAVPADPNLLCTLIFR